MISLARFNISGNFSSAGKRRLVAVAALAGFSLIASACAVQKENTYPIELFSEMHYSQAVRAQEPPRLQPPAESVVFEGAGGPDAVLDVPEQDRREYDPAVAAELFRVNCSVCHGVDGLGDGRTVPHLKSDQSFYARRVEDDGTLFVGPVMGADGGRRLPPNLQQSRETLTEAGIAAFIRSGGGSVMPTFSKFLSEEEIWDLVTYIKDTENGLGTQ
jgi:mono/diheme cytochrome c family protein